MIVALSKACEESMRALEFTVSVDIIGVTRSENGVPFGRILESRSFKVT
jgi:hypothetical protein